MNSNVFLIQLKVPAPDKPGMFVNFRKLLLNRCQKEFEKDQDDDEILEQKQKELDAAKDVRNRSVYLSPLPSLLIQSRLSCSPRLTHSALVSALTGR